MKINRVKGTVKINKVEVCYDIEVSGSEEDILEVLKTLKNIQKATNKTIAQEELEMESTGELELDILGFKVKSQGESKFSLKELVNKIKIVEKIVNLI